MWQRSPNKAKQKKKVDPNAREGEGWRLGQQMVAHALLQLFFTD